MINLFKKNPIQSAHKVAIVMPNKYALTLEIQKGFIQALSNGTSNYFFTTFNANGSVATIKEHIETIIHNNYNLLLTIDLACSLIAKEITNAQNIHIPIVFCAVTNATKLTVPLHKNHLNSHLTGVTYNIRNNYAEQLPLLLALKPTIKKILIAYDPYGHMGSEADIQYIRNFLKQHLIKAHIIKIIDKQKVLEKIKENMTDVDVLMVLRDHSVLAYIDHLVQLCNQQKTTLLAADLCSVEKGSALGFGPVETLMGQEAAKKAQLILEKNQKPSHIPITALNINNKMRINPRTMGLQGLYINPNLMFLIQYGHII